jgi:hypothetical protein
VAYAAIVLSELFEKKLLDKTAAVSKSFLVLEHLACCSFIKLLSPAIRS